MAQTPLKFFKLLAPPATGTPDSVYYIKTAPDLVESFVSDDDGNLIPVGGVSVPVGAFMVANRLSELDTPEAKAAARANLELQNIDGGTFN